jgi:hypothetical protein
MRSPRPSRLSLLTAFAALAGALATVSPATAAPPAPLLWAGEIRNATGQPSPAELVAYVRPPASQLTEGDALVPLARATAAPPAASSCGLPPMTPSGPTPTPPVGSPSWSPPSPTTAG